MKQIEAVIHQFKLQEVRNALDAMGIKDFMESSVVCHGQKGQSMIFRGARFVADIVSKVKLEIVATDDAADRIIETIRSIAKTERREDCRIAIRSYQEVT